MEAVVKEHYCSINECSEDEFREDFEAALAVKNEIEDRYNRNCRIEVDYGQWGRDKDKPRLTDDEKKLLRQVFGLCDEPISIEGRKFSNYGSAVKTLQSIPSNQREPILAELGDYLETEREDADFEMFPDHECPWDIRMGKF